MSLQLSGTIHSIGKPEQGISAKTGNPWRKQIFVLKYKDGTMDKLVELTCMGDRVDTVASLRAGQAVTCSFNLESREYNGKYYTNATCWKIETGQSQDQATQADSDLPF